MHKFAHIADCHLGAFREQNLRELNMLAFEKAIDDCILQKVDFIIIAGDLFDTSHPPTEILSRCVIKIMAAKKQGIPTYIVYGSHDYNLGGKSSIIDVLVQTGLFIQIVKQDYEEEKIVNEVLVDPKTGVKIAGMFGMPNSREIEYYEKLDLKRLEQEKGFKLFVFHSGIQKFMPQDLASVTAIPLSMLPKGFDYYAGSHIHKRQELDEKGYGKIIFPGILFGSSYTDLEQNLKEPNGYFIIHFDDNGIKKAELREIKVCDIIMINFDANKKSSTEARDKLNEQANETAVANKIVLLRVFGELSSGSIIDLGLYDVKRKLFEKGAIEVYTNSNKLQEKEKVELRLKVDDSMKPENIENMIFKELIGKSNFKTKEFIGANGVKLSEDFLRALRQTKKEGETNDDYHNRVLEPARIILSEIKNEA